MNLHRRREVLYESYYWFLEESVELLDIFCVLTRITENIEVMIDQTVLSVMFRTIEVWDRCPDHAEEIILRVLHNGLIIMLNIKYHCKLVGGLIQKHSYITAGVFF